MSEYQSEYYKANKERIRARQAEWRRNNEDWRASHRIEARATAKQWAVKNPNKRRQASADRRARQRLAFVESINPLVVFQRDQGICQLCNEPVDDKWHVDHVVPLALGGEHSYSNVQLSHPLCNIKKGARFPLTMYSGLSTNELE